MPPPFTWRFWFLAWGTPGIVTAGWVPLWWRLYRRGRVHNALPDDSLPCDDCGRVVPTAVSEVWCIAFPVGRLKRICDDCNSGYAGA